MDFSLDHVVIAAADLDRAQEFFADTTGCRSVEGGPHPAMGTRNALASFDASVYLELIAPDPAKASQTNLGGALTQLDAPVLFAWALRAKPLPKVRLALRSRGIESTPVLPTTREQPTGELLAWELMGLPNTSGAWPFFIDWGETPHPSDKAPSVGSIHRFAATLPVRDVAALPFVGVPGVELSMGTPRLELAFDSPRGRIEWDADEPRGFFA